MKGFKAFAVCLLFACISAVSYGYPDGAKPQNITGDECLQSSIDNVQLDIVKAINIEYVAEVQSTVMACHLYCTVADAGYAVVKTFDSFNKHRGICKSPTVIPLVAHYNYRC